MTVDDMTNTGGKQSEHSKNDVNDSDKPNGNCDKKKDLYLGTDKGPYLVHLTVINTTNDDVIEDIHDVNIGLKLKQLKVIGITEIKKISRRELKIIFLNKEDANLFLKGRIPNDLKLNAFIPKYNITKTGIIFDIPTHFDEQYLMENLESDLPIIGVFRCQKRKVMLGRKTKEWIPSNTVKVTFRGQMVPDEVIFGYSKRKVKPDVPNVVQCYRCMRFGHILKFCKQHTITCSHCGTQHELDPNVPCTKPTKCFHCHSDSHDALFKECPEYLRNHLIKESMYYNNMTFFEANELFPRTQSHYRIAEKHQEFPDLPRRKNLDREERIERSFPRKTTQDLVKQYNDYIQTNKGVKPTETISSTSPTYSEKAREHDRNAMPSKGRHEHGMKIITETQERNQDSYNDNSRRQGDAMNFIQDLSHRIFNSHTDPDQNQGNSADNDLLLIDIGRMIMDFIQVTNRKVVSYSSEEDKGLALER